MKLKKWLIEWRENYKKPFLTKRSYQLVISATNKVIISNLANKDLQSIKSIDIQKFYNKFARSRAKEFLILYLNAAMQKAEDLELITKNPCRAITKDKKIHNVRLSLNFNEQEKLLEYIKGSEFEEIILFYLLTGCRRCEALGVKWDDINIKNRCIRVNGTKTATSVRDVDISQNYLNHLLKLKKNSKTLHLFTFSKTYLERGIKKIFKHLKIDAVIHSLRHTYSTNQYYLGTPEKQRQVWLGHASPLMTNNVYTHIDKSISKNKIIKLYRHFYYFIK